MSVIRLVLITSCLVALATARNTIQLNRIFDDLLTKVNSEAASNITADTLHVPNFALNASRTAAFVTVGAKVGFEDVKITGLLKSLRRNGDVVEFKHDVLSGRHMVVRVRAKDLKFNMTGLVKVLGVGPRYLYAGEISSIDMDLTLWASDTSDGLYTIKMPRVHDLVGLTIKVKGHPLSLPWLNERFLRSVHALFENAFKLPVAVFAMRVLADDMQKWKVSKELNQLPLLGQDGHL